MKMDEFEKISSSAKDGFPTARILSNHQDAWEEKLAQVVVEDRPLKTIHVKNGIILPIRKRNLTEVQAAGAFDGIFEGGVTTKRFRFVAGVTRHSKRPMSNYSCNSGYRPSTPLRKRDESVVFGGVVYGHYGHLLTDGLVRMWWLAQNQDLSLKVVFAAMPGESTELIEKLLAIAGIPENRYEFAEEPTQYREVLVPEEAAFSLEGRVNRAWLSFFDLLVERSKVLSAVETYAKVYLTRSKWHKADGINEEYYENYFSSQGYQVVAPEYLPLEDQIKLYASASHIACTMGTLSHAALFAREGTGLTCLLRCDTIVMQQLIVNEVRQLDWTMFDAHANVLPTIQGCGAYLYAPTRHFRAYLAREGISYPVSEELRQQVVSEHLGEYLRLWLHTYEDPRLFRAVFKQDIADLLVAVKLSFQDELLDVEAYPTYQDCKIEFLSRQNERRLVRRVKRVLRKMGVKV